MKTETNKTDEQRDKLDVQVRSKCKIEDNHVIPCETLEGILNMDNARKGVSIVQLTNVDTGDKTRNMVCAYSGEYQKRGMILNYCPMCGAKISSHIE